MKIERAAWIIIVALLLVALTTTNSRYRSLKTAVLAGDSDRPYTSAALALFSKEEHVDKATVAKDFYLTYVGFSDQVCIALVPKPSMWTVVTGGATTYCFTRGSPIRLVKVDREGD